MMSSYFISLMLFAVASTGTPGPNNLMMLSSGLNFGVKQSIPHWLGICTGVPMVIVAVGLGLDQLFQRWPVSFLVLKGLGVVYLIYLAFKIATAKNSLQARNSAKPFSYVQGALFQWVNPKVWVMVLSALTAFTLPEQPLLPQVATIAVVFFLIGAVCVGSWLVAGSQLQRLFTQPKQRRVFNWMMASLLLCSIATMVPIF